LTKDPSISPEILKVLEENIRKHVNTSPFIDICNDFYMTPKAQGTKAKTDK
jgi:hypothetical protein